VKPPVPQLFGLAGLKGVKFGKQAVNKRSRLEDNKNSNHKSLSMSVQHSASLNCHSNFSKSVDDKNHESVVLSGHKITVIADVELNGGKLPTLNALEGRNGSNLKTSKSNNPKENEVDEICTFPMDDDELTIQFNLKGHPLKEHVTWYSRSGKSTLKDLKTSGTAPETQNLDLDLPKAVKFDDGEIQKQNLNLKSKGLVEETKSNEVLIEFPSLKSSYLESSAFPKDQVMRSLSTPENKSSLHDPVFRSSSTPVYVVEDTEISQGRNLCSTKDSLLLLNSPTVEKNQLIPFLDPVTNLGETTSFQLKENLLTLKEDDIGPLLMNEKKEAKITYLSLVGAKVK